MNACTFHSMQRNYNCVASDDGDKMLDRNGDNLFDKERMVYVVVIGMMSVVAVIGNTAVCFTLLNFKMPSRQFLINLAISDIIVGSLVMPCCVVTLCMKKWVFGWPMCNIVAFLKTASLFSSALSLCSIAIDRYLSIKNVRYRMKLSHRVLGLLVPWLFSGMTATGPLLGWGDYIWSSEKPVCTVDWLHSPSYTLFCFIGFGFIPEVFIFCCYFRIANHVRRKKNNVRRFRPKVFALPLPPAVAEQADTADIRLDATNPRSQPTPGASPQAARLQAPRRAERVILSREEIGVLKSIVVVVFVFSTVAFPYIITQLLSLSWDTQLSLRVETINTSLLYIGACLNPFIYSGGSSKFRKALKKTLLRPFRYLKN